MIIRQLKHCQLMEIMGKIESGCRTIFCFLFGGLYLPNTLSILVAMLTVVNQIPRFILLVFCCVCFWNCSGNAGSDPQTVSQRNEQSANPSVRLSGTYTCVRLQLDNGYTEGRGQVKGKGYTAVIEAKGDSIRFSLTGDGTAGRYDQLDMGTYAVQFRPIGGSNGDYFTVKKDILDDYNAVTVIDRLTGPVNPKTITYSCPITLYQFLADTPRAGQLTPIKATDIFTTTQRIVAIFTFERTLMAVN